MNPVSISDILAPGKHLFLSPHYDDIALSCGGTAALVSLSGREATVALIFGNHPDPTQPMTEFANQLHNQWGLGPATVIASRRAEEENASAILGLQDMYLPFRDAIYREERYLSNDDLFAAPAIDEETLPDEIVASLGPKASDRRNTRIYAPLAIGNHVDHQLAFATGLRLAHDDWEVFFFEDLPYALIPDRADERLAAIGSRLDQAAIVDVSSVWEKKIDAIMAYPSQLGVIFGEYVGGGSRRQDVDQVMGEYSRSAGGGILAERFWRIGT